MKLEFPLIYKIWLCLLGIDFIWKRTRIASLTHFALFILLFWLFWNILIFLLWILTELFESVVDCRLILVSKHSHLEVDVVSSIGILRLSQSLLPFKPILPLGLIFLQFCLHYHIQFLRFNICVCFKISSVLAYTLR